MDSDDSDELLVCVSSHSDGGDRPPMADSGNLLSLWHIDGGYFSVFCHRVGLQSWDTGLKNEFRHVSSSQEGPICGARGRMSHGKEGREGGRKAGSEGGRKKGRREGV